VNSTYYGDLFIRKLIKQYAFREACSSHGGVEKCVQNFGWKAGTEETTLKTQMQKRTILKSIFVKLMCKCGLV
jgi:hypothetical protein